MEHDHFKGTIQKQFRPKNNLGDLGKFCACVDCWFNVSNPDLNLALENEMWAALKKKQRKKKTEIWLGFCAHPRKSSSEQILCGMLGFFHHLEVTVTRYMSIVLS